MYHYYVLIRFATQTRVGIWYETDLDDIKFKEYLHKKQQGANETLYFHSLVQAQELSLSEDGLVHKRDCVELSNERRGCPIFQYQ